MQNTDANFNRRAYKAQLTAGGKTYEYYPVNQFAGAENLPISLKVLLENVVRNAKTESDAQAAAARILDAAKAGQAGAEVEFSPARVLFQDFTGVPVFVDFAVMREAAANLGADPNKINPQVPCDLVIDHSVIANEYGCKAACESNMRLEFERNEERYKFLKWAQSSFENVRIVPPGQGICHQLNIEKFANVVTAAGASDASAGGTASGVAGTAADSAAGDNSDAPLAYFDTLVGTDSHTPTANGIGVLGWGVGGIEAEAAALGQPISILVPRVIGVRLTGHLRPGVTGMDVSLTFANVLRERGVVGCFVECFGPGVATLSATQRACISNMTPEYGCTCTLFPVDSATLDYLRVSGRSEDEINLVREYAKAQGFWGAAEDAQVANACADSAEGAGAAEGESVAKTGSGSDLEKSSGTIYSEIVEIDLSKIERSIAGPSRPHDRIALSGARACFHKICEERSLDAKKFATVNFGGSSYELTHGALAIAAVTSCTTATDHAMMLAAGLVARNAVRAGLKPKPWVKTIFAPGSHANTLLLERAGLLDAMDALGFSNCGYGCMSCIGNSGPVLPQMHDIAQEIELASVLSGNRNFEGRISADVSQNYLCAPALVIAYALAGTMDFDLEHDALGKNEQGSNIYLKDIWPDSEEIAQLISEYVDASLYVEGSAGMFEGTSAWQQLDARAGGPDEGDTGINEAEGADAVARTHAGTFNWGENSTYVRRAPYFDGMTAQPKAPKQIKYARVLANLGDFITTDHISPAGAIAPDSPAALYLREHGVAEEDFNTYGSRRGNHEVMMRGTFANVKLQNKLACGRCGGWTRDMSGVACAGQRGGYTASAGSDAACGVSGAAGTSGSNAAGRGANSTNGNIVPLFNAAMNYASQETPLIVLAGKMYGSGSSRDWAAKGPQLLGVRAVIAESYERIHRSNLIGMGVLPLQFESGENAETLGLDGSETFTIERIDFSDGLPKPATVLVVARKTGCAGECADDGAEGAGDAVSNETCESATEVKFSAKVRIDTPTEGEYYANGGILQFVLRSLM